MPTVVGQAEVEVIPTGRGRFSTRLRREVEPGLRSLRQVGNEATRGIDLSGRLARSLSGTLQTVGRAAAVGVAGIAALTTSMVGLGAASVTTFADFQSGINEVFTLLPDADRLLRDTLSDGVLDLGAKFGVVSDESIPALYDALSSGVPPDNVLGFLDQSFKVAQAGATDAQTAVNLLTSVTNSYGTEAISAAEASDVLFTTIRLGKTNADQLNAALGNVLANASDAGVGFDELGAALAATTAQGVNTAQSSTALRSLFVELTRDGTNASKVFREIAGTDFRDFTANGGDLQQALNLLEKQADESGLAISDLFGSVEAGQAALLLTGSGGEIFANNLAQMADAAGATDAAYATMADNLQVVFGRIRASFERLQIEVGGRLEPVITSAAGVLEDLVAGPVTTFALEAAGGVSAFAAAWQAADGDITSSGFPGQMERLANFLRGPGTDAFELIVGAAGRVRGALSGLDVGGAIGAAGPVLSSLFSGLVENVGEALPLLIEFGGELAESLGPALLEVFESLSEARSVVFDALIAAFEVLSPVVSDLARTVLPVLVDSFGQIVEAAAPIVAELLPVFADLVSGLAPVVAELASVIAGVLVAAWDALQPLVDRLVTDLLPKLVDLFVSVAPVVAEVASVVGSVLVGALEIAVPVLMGLLDAAEAAFGWLRDNVPGILGTVGGAIGGAASAVSGVFVGAWEKVKPVVEPVAKFLADVVVKTLETLSGLVSDIAGFLSGAFTKAWETLKPAVEGVSDVLSTVGDVLSDVIGFVADSAVATFEAFETVIGGVASAFETVVGWAGDVKDAIAGMLGPIGDAIGLLGDLISAAGGALSAVGGALNPFDGDIVPFFADGGIVRKATAAVLGEAGPEVVIPLTRPGRALELAAASGLLQILRSELTGAVGRVAAPATSNVFVDDSASVASTGSATPVPVPVQNGGVTFSPTYNVQAHDPLSVMAEIEAYEEARMMETMT